MFHVQSGYYDVSHVFVSSGFYKRNSHTGFPLSASNNTVPTGNAVIIPSGVLLPDHSSMLSLMGSDHPEVSKGY